MKDVSGMLLMNEQKIENRRKEYFLLLLNRDNKEKQMTICRFSRIHQSVREEQRYNSEWMKNSIKNLKNEGFTGICTVRNSWIPPPKKIIKFFFSC